MGRVVAVIAGVWLLSAAVAMWNTADTGTPELSELVLGPFYFTHS